MLIWRFRGTRRRCRHRFTRFDGRSGSERRSSFPTPPECRLLFGAGLTTPPECLTEGLRRSLQAFASEAFACLGASPKEGDLSVKHLCGVWRPAHNKIIERRRDELLVRQSPTPLPSRENPPNTDVPARSP